MVIAYYWPPAGGPGVQRWLKFVKYLPEFGYEPIVYVPENADYPIVDKSMLDDIPENLRILKQPISEPYRWASFLSTKKTKRISSGIIPKEEKQSALDKLLLWIRGNFFIPDARKSWVRPSVSFLSKIIQQENIQSIITTGPPHSLHLIGLQLKQQFPNIQWTTDFRDPWTSIGYHKKLKLTKASQQKHKALEHQVLISCDKIVVTSGTTKNEFRALTQKPIKVITNGFEPLVAKAGTLDEKFTISHIGSLLTDRNPTVLWDVLQDLVHEHKALGEHLNIRLIGVVGEAVLQSLEKYGLADFVTNLGYVGHDEVLQYQHRSQVLLLTEINAEETKGIIPGKLFEYLNAQRPILAIGPMGWEAGQMVEATESGVYFRSNDKNGLKKVLLNWYGAYKNNSLQVAPSGIEKYSRRSLTKSLAEYIAWESS